MLLQDLDMYDPNPTSLIPDPAPPPPPPPTHRALLIIHPHFFYIIMLQLGDKFLREKGFKHVHFLSADGALESYPPVSLLSRHFIPFCFHVIPPLLAFLFCNFFHVFILNLIGPIVKVALFCSPLVLKFIF